MIKTLVAGPWLGEFGWELFAWQGHLRTLSKSFDRTIIIAQGNTSLLYNDFSDTYLSFEPKNKNLSDCFHMKGYEYNLVDVYSTLKENKIILDKNHTHYYLPRSFCNLSPMSGYNTVFPSGIEGIPPIKPSYIKFGEKTPTIENIIVFHARNRPQGPKVHNWDIDKWKELCSLYNNAGYQTVSIGTLQSSFHVPGSLDKRNITMEETVSIIRNSRCVLGTSSGPMHLASLCNTPHIVWSIESNRQRYYTKWNPHVTPVIFLSCDTNSSGPPPSIIYNRYKEWEIFKEDQK
tara:strand:+ start:1622 stop:2491 length:870 start_codon:yes stop_codon:yes gene_type:complete